MWVTLKMVVRWLGNQFGRMGRILHVAIVIGFVVSAVEMVYGFVASQQEFGFLTVAALVGLFWVLLGGFVLYTDGMEVVDAVVDWFQLEPSGEKGKRSKRPPEM